MSAGPSIESLMEQHRRPAILVRRIYPPADQPLRNSRLGGRPLLPDGVDWPRASGGVPYHFMAQIDCAELPPNDGVLPESGILFFFAAVTGSLDWGSQYTPDPDQSRVLYAPVLGKQEAVPPPDLPATSGSGHRVKGIPYYRAPGDLPSGVFPAWPVEFRTGDSWPHGWALFFSEDTPKEIYRTALEQADQRWREDYRPAVNAAEGEQIKRLFGVPPWKLADWAQRFHTAPDNRLAFPAAKPDHPFPQVWVMIDRVARHLVAHAVKQESARNQPTGAQADMLAEIRRVGMEWVTAAQAQGLDTATDPETARRFFDWLQDLAGQGGAWFKMAQEAIRCGIGSAIQYAAASPSAAAQIPQDYYLALFDHMQPHQMLGAAPTHAEAGEVMLLHLHSDPGVDFMFGDAGELAFWISKNDLVARRFDAAFATVDSS